MGLMTPERAAKPDVASRPRRSDRHRAVGAGRSGRRLLLVVLVAAFLSPLVQAALTAREVPGPDHPGRTLRCCPSDPATFEFEGETYDVYEVPVDGDRQRTGSGQAGPNRERVSRPGQPGGRSDRLAGILANPRSGLAAGAGLDQLLGRLDLDRVPPPALQHDRDRGHRHHRHRGVLHAGRLRVRPVSIPRAEHAFHPVDRDDLPPIGRHSHPHLHDLCQAGMAGNVAAIAGPGLLRQRLRRVPAPPVSS